MNEPPDIEFEHLKEYVDNHSDFSFELNIFNMLCLNGFSCIHGGTYVDPVTQKPRQFDIRATKMAWTSPESPPLPYSYNVKLAVECKNVTKKAPLLISCMPREPSESYHEIIVSTKEGEYLEITEPERKTFRPERMDEIIARINQTGEYKSNQSVGKDCSQVISTSKSKRDGGGFVLKGSDKDIYEKWAQAISSCNDLVNIIFRQKTELVTFNMVIPVLVVPDETLWTVDYDKQGNRISDPKAANRVSYFIGKSIPLPTEAYTKAKEYRISHMEIFTKKGLEEFAKSIDDNIWDFMNHRMITNLVNRYKTTANGENGVVEN